MPAIRRQINIAASPRAVWRALTTSEGLARWWDPDVRMDGREGGRIVVGAEDTAQARGMVHTWRPTSHLELSFDKGGASEWRGSHVAFKLARDADESRLTMVHSGGEALEDEARRKTLEGQWDRALVALQTALDEP